MSSNSELSLFELLLPEIHEEIFKHLSGEDLKCLFLVSHTIGSCASECNILMRKVIFNYQGVDDLSSGRKYLALCSDVRCKFSKAFTISQFQDLVQKFQHIEYLRIVIKDVIIDEAFDNAMNSLTRLKRLDLFLYSFSGLEMPSRKSWTLNNLEFLYIQFFFHLFSPGKEITKKFESVQSIKRLCGNFQDFYVNELGERFGGEFSSSQLQVISDFIANLSNLEVLDCSGCAQSKTVILPKNVKLPIKHLVLKYFTTSIHCPEFVTNCMSTLESISGNFSIETCKVLMKSLKLTKMHWNYSDYIDTEDIANFQTNRSIKSFAMGPLIIESDAMNALIQKCEALSSIEVANVYHARIIHSANIKSLKLSHCSFKKSDWDKLKLNLPNIEFLDITRREDESEKVHEILNIIAEQEWNLKYLKINNFNDVSVDLDTAEYLLEYCPSLSTLISVTCDENGQQHTRKITKMEYDDDE